MASPIIYLPNYISPLKCLEENVDFVENKVTSLKPIINQYYSVHITSISIPVVSTYLGRKVGNSRLTGGKWQRISNIDFICYIPLRNHNSNNFDEETDVYGANMVFERYNQIYVPKIGDVLVFPAAPNFTHYHTECNIGKYKYIQILIQCIVPYHFNYTQFSSGLF
jgi:hypothetical protein